MKLYVRREIIIVSIQDDLVTQRLEVNHIRLYGVVIRWSFPRPAIIAWLSVDITPCTSKYLDGQLEQFRGRYLLNWT